MVFIKKIKQTIEITMVKEFAYVKSNYIGIVSTVLQILIMYYLWQVVYAGKDTINGMSLIQMNTYLILSQAISIQFNMGIDNKVSSDIHDGNIIFDLLKPIKYSSYLLGIKLGQSAAVILMKWPCIFIVSALFFGFGLPASFLHFVCFCIVMFLSSLMLFFVEFMVGLVSFYTLTKYGVRTLKQALLSFLSGTLVPLNFLPGWLATITNVLPFKYIVSTPANIYIGIIPKEELIINILIQIFWIIVLWILSKIFYSHTIKKVTIHGG